MNKNLKGLLLTLVLIFVVATLSACNIGGNNEDTPNDNFYITCLEENDIIMHVNEKYFIKYDTNITEPLTFTSSNQTVAKINYEGEISAISKGNTTIIISYGGLTAKASVTVLGEKKQAQYLTVYGQDEIKLESYKMTIAVYLKKLFGDVMHQNIEGKIFAGYYLDEEFTKPVDLQQQIDTNLTIYPKYVKDEQISDMIINVNKVLIHNSKVEQNDAIQVFSADFGDTVKYENLTYENSMLITVRYNFNKNGHFVTAITKDGAKQDTKIPYDGFIIMIPQTNPKYFEVKDLLKIDDRIDLNDYSINRASQLYVNRQTVKYADKLNFSINCEFISVYDATNEVMIYEKNQYNKAYPASTTKIITALAALQHTSLDTVVTIGDELDVMYEGDSPGTAELKKGQKWTIRQLLYAMLLPSGNDAAYSVAAGTVRSIDKYKGKTVREQLEIFNGFMNDVKDQVGATRSHFMVPDGNSYYNYTPNKVWDDRITNHYVTSDDMIKFARLAFNYPGIALVTSTPSISFSVESGESFYYNNTNRCIRKGDANYYPYAVGMKTGTTIPAGQCLVAGAYRDGRMIIVALMRNDDNRFYNAKKIFETILQ